jgi:hypothetical protein
MEYPLFRAFLKFSNQSILCGSVIAVSGAGTILVSQSMVCSAVLIKDVRTESGVLEGFTFSVMLLD